MKTCSLHDFISELTPWLDSHYIHRAQVDEQSQFILHFTDGTKNVYNIEDCNQAQIENVLTRLNELGITTLTPPGW
jgi:hypothetical protein